jgi:hypothetical protein
MSYRELRDLIDKLPEEKLDKRVMIFYGPSGDIYTAHRLTEYEEGEDGPEGYLFIVAD